MYTKYNKINTPEELFDFMNKNIVYGYLGKDKKIHTEEDNDIWEEEYILETKDDILEYKIGNCWDQVELERDWFKEHNYEFETIYHQVMLNYNNPYPTHTMLIYKDNDEWCWFENAWESEKGIHRFKTKNDLLKCEYKKYIEMLKIYGINNEELDKIRYFVYDEPKSNISAKMFIKHTINGKMLTEVDKFQTEIGRTQL